MQMESRLSAQELPPKKDVALFLLQRSSVFMHLDPRSDDVIVPPGFKREPRLVLQIGYKMAVAIPDLAIEADGWSGTLSFRKQPFRCVVPWSRVFAMVGEDGQGMVWPEDVPPELAQPAQASAPAARAEGKVALAPAPAASGPTLAEEKSAAPAPAEDAKAKGKAKGKGGKKKKSDGAPESAPPASSPDLDAVAPPAAEPAAKPEPAPTPVAAAPKPGQPGKPKRELPPYLRVIK